MNRLKFPSIFICIVAVTVLLFSCGGGSGDDNSSGNQDVTNNINIATDCIFVGAFESVLGFLELDDLTSDPTEELSVNVEIVAILEDTLDIEAIVYDFIDTGSFPDPGRLLAADRDVLLELSTSSSDSRLIGVFGVIEFPDQSAVNIDDVDGLAYDPNNNIFYGSNRLEGLDYIFTFEIDDSGNESVIDNVQLLAVMPGNIQCGNVACSDIDDLAFDSLNNRLLGIINGGVESDNLLVEINTDDGSFEEIGVIYTENCSVPVQDIEGLGVTLNGRIFATSGIFGNFTNDFFELAIDDDSAPARVCATWIIALESFSADNESLDCSIDTSL